MLQLLLFIAALQGTFNARLEAEGLSAMVGERVGVMLVVETPPGYAVDFPTLGDWGVFGVVSVEAPIVEASDMGLVHTQQFEVIPWQTGALFSPPLSISYRAEDGTATGQIPVAPLRMDIIDTLEADTTLRTSRRTVDLPYVQTWLYVAGGTGLAAAVIGGAYVAQRSLRQWGQRDIRGGRTPRTMGELAV